VSSKQSVLIVDRSDDSRAVLRMALQRRGLEIFEASRYEAARQWAQGHPVDLVVVDLERQGLDIENSAESLERQQDWGEVPLVLLGSARRKNGKDEQTGGRQFIAKPYRYGPLIRRIEELLETSQQADRAA
jgi:DNA-binding response OmpR family regulator